MIGDAVRIAVEPYEVAGLAEALRGAGARLVEPAEAEAIIWTAPGESDGLAARLSSLHRWVALPIGGVEDWLASGLVDASRTWTCARGVYADGVAEHGLALLLAGARRLPACARARRWQSLPGRRLRGATVAVLGAGSIGARLAELLGPLGVRTVAVTRLGEPVAGFAETLPADGLERAAFGADFLVVAAPLTPRTERAVGPEVLAALGPSGALVNLSRGRIVDTGALVEALRAAALGGALLDVTDPEPLPPDHPLWTFEEVLITPHVANPNRGSPWDSHREELIEHLVANVRAFAAGEPLAGEIDLEAGY